MIKLFRKKFSLVDKRLLSILLVIMLIGLLFVYTSSYIESIVTNGGVGLYYTIKHFITIILCFFIILVMTTLLKPSFFYRFAKLLMIFTGISLWLLIPIGSVAGGAQSVFTIGPISFQPLEIAKISTIVYMAFYYTKYQNILQKLSTHFKLYVEIGIAILIPLLLQPDLGGVLVIGFMMVIITLISGINLWTFFKMIIPLFLIAIIAVILSFSLFEHQSSRITTWLNPIEAYQNDPNKAEGFQMTQAYIGMAHGGPLGVGIGNGYQKAGYMPEAHTDMISIVIAEETGIIGFIFVLFLEILLALVCIQIGLRSTRLFNALMAYGVGALILVQTFINVGGATGFIPLTGVTLPFISYGTNSMLFLTVAIGIVLIISIQNKVDKNAK